MNNDTITCPNCGTKNSVKADFCNNCGNSLHNVLSDHQVAQKQSLKRNRLHRKLAVGAFIAIITIGATGITLWHQMAPKNFHQVFAAVGRSFNSKGKVTRKKTNASDSKKKNSNNQVVQTKTLDQLSQKDLNKITFKFSTQQYMSVQATMERLLVTIDNSTDKNIQFDPNKLHSDMHLYLAEPSATFTITAHSKVATKILFNACGLDITTDDMEGYWRYGSNSLKLSLIDDTTAAPKDPTAPDRTNDGAGPTSSDRATDASQSASESSDSDSNDDTTDSAADDNNSSDTDNESDTITSSDQAITAVKNKMGDSVNGVPVNWGVMSGENGDKSQDDNGNDCYFVRGKRTTDKNMSSYDNLDFYVYPNGTISARSGNMYNKSADDK